MKRQLHKLYKSLRYDEADARRYGYLGIDYVDIQDDVYTFMGWFFDWKHERIENRRLVLRDMNGEHVFQIQLYGGLKEELAENLQDFRALHAGFYGRIRILSPFKLMANIEYEAEGGTYSTLLFEVKPLDIGLDRPIVEEIYPYPSMHELPELKRCPERLNLHEGMLGNLKDPVDVIVPVYDGMRFLPKLFSSIEKTKIPFRLTIVDDDSPDENVRIFLDEYASKHQSHVVLLRNKENLGFLKSVNRGLENTTGHVVIVNTDVELPDEWLERMIGPVLGDSTIASVTPFTNSGTICSFPRFCEDNDLQAGLSVQEMDAFFKDLPLEVFEVPTGVGFCMAMSRAAIDAVGVFDAENFGRGYGEENDWCQRAAKAGFRNVHISNLFVRHNHGGSFDSDEKKLLVNEHLKALDCKHPNYGADVGKYVRKDPARFFRKLVMRQIMDESDAESILIFDHMLGGGATSYAERKACDLLGSGYRVSTIRYDAPLNIFVCEMRLGAMELNFTALDVETLIKGIGSIDEIWVNELVTYPNVVQMLRYIPQLALEQEAKLVFLLHDYYCICQNYNLLNDAGHFCDLPDAATCESCFHKIRKKEFCGTGIGAYRRFWGDFLSECDEVIAFSKASIGLLERAYPGLDNIVLRPHHVDPLPEMPKKQKSNDKLIVGVLGLISYAKGRDVLIDLVDYVDEQGLDVEFVIIGMVDVTKKEHEVLKPIETGAYDRDEVPKIALEKGIDVFFIPSIWPETFSYTTSEIMSMGYPLAVFDLGAPAERVAEYEKGAIISRGASCGQIIAALEKLDRDAIRSNQACDV